MSGKIISVRMPGSGQTTTWESASAGSVQFDFDPSATTTVREGNNLMFTSDNGGKVVLTNFFVVGDAPLPVLTLPDGAQVAAAEYLKDQFPGLDLTTAAGPSAAPGSSGVGEYADGSGSSLVGGLERFGSLGTDYWSSAGPTFENPVSVSSLSAPDNPAGTPGGDITPPGPPTPSNEFSRLIVSNASSNPAMVITVEDAAGAPVTGATPQFDFEDNKFFRIKSFDPATGKLELELTAEGLLARQNNQPMNDKLTITVNGESYELHLIGDQDAGYISDEDPNLRSEWFVSDGGLANADVTLGGKFTNEATINGPAHLTTAYTYTKYTWVEDPDHLWGGYEVEETVSDEVFAGVADSRIDTGERGLVHINVDNSDSSDDAAQRVAGIFGRSSADNTTIIGNEIDITARVSNAHGTPISEWSPLYSTYSGRPPQAMAAGIDNNRGTVSVTAGNKLTILGETRVEADGTEEDYYGNIFSGAGIRTGGLEDPDYWSKMWDDQGNALPQGSLSLQADVLEIKGAVSADATLGNHSIYADGLYARSGSVDLTGSKISIEGAIDAYLSSSEGWNGDLYSAAGLSALGQNGDLRNTEQEFLSTVKINGTGADDDRLDVTATINLEGEDAFKSPYISQKVVGIQATLADLSIRDIEHISVTAKAAALEEPQRPNQRFYTESIGMDLHESTVDITNNGNLTLEVTAGDRGIDVSQGWSLAGSDYDARLNVHAGQTLTVDIEAGSLGIYSNVGSSQTLGEDPRVRFSSDGALNMTVSVHDGTPNFAYNPNGLYVAGIESLGDSYRKLWGEVEIEAGGPLNLTVDVSTPYETFQFDPYTGEVPVNAYSLFAHDYGVIDIHSAGGADSISLTGDVRAASNGIVDIATGAGADTLSITGHVTAEASSKIHFDLGADADTFTLNGNLSALGASTELTVDMGSGDDTVYLNGYSDSSGFHSTELSGNVRLDGGDGDDLLCYKFTKADDLTSLAAAAGDGKITGFEHLLLDMADGVDQSLQVNDLDALLSNLSKVAGGGQADVYIKGDAGDTLDLGGWNNTGQTFSLDGVDYALYQNGVHQLYIQLSLSAGG